AGPPGRPRRRARQRRQTIRACMAVIGAQYWPPLRIRCPHPIMIQQRARTFTAYGFVLGLAGFLGLGLLLGSGPAPRVTDLLEASVLIVLAAVSWRLSFSILSRTRFSLDLSYMMTALLCYAAPVPLLVGAGTAVLGSFLRHRAEPLDRRSGLASR